MHHFFYNDLDSLMNVYKSNEYINLSYKDFKVNILPNHVGHTIFKIISHDNTKFYLKDMVNPSYILAIKDQNHFTHKISLDLMGNYITQVKDKIEDSLILRETNNSIIKFDTNDNKIINVKTFKLNVKPIPLSDQNYTINENVYIGVIDLEVYRNDSKNKEFVYSAGIYTTFMDKKPAIYYIDESFNSNKIILDMIDEMFTYKNSKITFYCHNFGKYDIYFILKVLIEFNEQNAQNQFKLNFTFRDNVILKLKVSKKYKNKTISITICDSYAILTDSLMTLCHKFKVDSDNFKGVFPHKFANENRLFYKGSTPHIMYYGDKISQSEYDSIYSDNWNFKEESNKYLIKDLLSLHEVITKFNHELFLNFNLNITDILTISGLAQKIFKKFYYKKSIIPLINTKEIYNDVKLSYYGGKTEVFRPQGKDLYYYDVNSLYPFVALNDMPGCEVSYIEFYNDDYNLNDLFGMFYCDISTKNYDGYIGLLPVRDSKRGLIFPLGSWSGWYFSEELKFVKKMDMILKLEKVIILIEKVMFLMSTLTNFINLNIMKINMFYNQ